MMDRCYNEKSKAYKRYGLRGIKVCKEWHDPKCFIEQMKNTYEPHLTLERVNNDQGYSYENCVWADRKAQANNRSTNRLIELDDEVRTLSQWCTQYGLTQRTVLRRINRLWSAEKAITTPVRRYK
jgi:hypothetical protein